MRVMAPRSGSVLQSFSEALHTGEENEDRLTELTEEILLLIISNLNMSECGRFSLVSRRCELLWRYVPVLIFEYSEALKESSDSIWGCDIIVKEIPHFVNRVNHVLEKHLGSTIDELRITSDLDHEWQSHIDKWAAFALDKQVKRLEFNFFSYLRNQYQRDEEGRLSPPLCGTFPGLSPAFAGYKSCLRSLSLTCVNVTDAFVNCLSHECPLLESLCIVGSECLTTFSGSLHLKHLEVCHCRKLRKINISATKLRSFIFYGEPIELLIEDAATLSEMSFSTEHSVDFFSRVFAMLPEYFPQLVYLSLRSPSVFFMKESFDVDNMVALPNLQHLEFRVGPYFERLSLLSSLIAACPNIQKLTLKLAMGNPYPTDSNGYLQKWDGFPLKCLKTLEIVGYVGLPVDLELAFFVIENASMLKEVIVDFSPRIDIDQPDANDKPERLVKLQMKLPQHVKLTVK